MSRLSMSDRQGLSLAMRTIALPCQKALEQVALNSLRKGISVEIVARITELTVERVQQL
ncbi:hypothetical protein [Nostoc sp. DedQUE09]|uniref:hypothetical protein n=1 Tax=Nostoc sp. DedQUE09 TaxID=3075394 RepID=UPI002AD473FA|nr:hypothetical protein [Nostoc sp. DedQUE09]MDZ7955276.1 hypothetical protein [Nostoc sp. DedQUE09]